MMGDRNFAASAVSSRAFDRFLVGFGCLYLVIVGVVMSAIGVGILAGIKYVFDWSPF